MAAQLDTWGIVLPFHRYDPRWNAEPCGYAWSDLPPFTQGYVEALSAEWSRLDAPDRRMGALRWGFSHLAPETLARIMEDCERALSPHLARANTLQSGADFWALRHRGIYSGNPGQPFPPLTPYLGDDGKVYLREDASQHASDTQEGKRGSEADEPPTEPKPLQGRAAEVVGLAPIGERTAAWVRVLKAAKTDGFRLSQEASVSLADILAAAESRAQAAEARVAGVRESLTAVLAEFANGHSSAITRARALAALNPAAEEGSL